jgi:myo-inositol-1(or 4)-monophosphatase
LPARDLDLLLAAALKAGEVASGYFRTSMQVRDKGGGQGPVSEADLAVDTLLRETLLAARPDYGWLSEETEDGAARLSKGRVFIVDPIDGTRSFVDGNPTFAHSLAVAEDGEVTAAVVHLPEMGLTYAARKGAGATLNAAPMAASRRAELDGAQVIAARPQLDPSLWPGGVPNIDRHYRPSLAWRLCLIAEGKFDGMVTLRDAWEWDIAAGDLICREAGAAVTDREGQPLRFNNRVPQRPGVLAASRGVHAGLLARLGR